jgi:hypothetical protein
VRADFITGIDSFAEKIGCDNDPVEHGKGEAISQGP